ncbi:efflux RND transporter periplasmic adaptor subunit [Flavihumibacter petaseus]|uniref:RND-type efflux pump membrane fusion protein n=1 Tax=Flavihumibacter petaseus NBRC 106054 TaxID=1220578 RepID=A0A0E9N3H1_9BACT|nr:efflux RND transporter periplasmic adaptor subunit [Flavihumibacter petaseus]GAO44522.1 RND-type efflux pump membrane fusion protein [Flavihumibacter petaseus NBRC 106054]
MNKHLINFVILLSMSLLAACGGEQKAKPEQVETEHQDEHENSNTTSLSAQQLKSIGIETGMIENKQLTASLKANGVLQVPNHNRASVNSMYSGVVKSLLIQPGNTVSKGQVIATISNPEFLRAQEEYLGIHPQIELAELEYNRQKELNQGNAGALKNLQAADAHLKTLRTRKASLLNQIRLMGINPSSLSSDRLVSVLSIRSPINGVVSTVQVKIGSFVESSTPITEIVDNSQLHLDLFVYEKDLPKLKENQTIHFTLTNNPGKEYDADIYSLGSSFEGESKAVTVHAKVKGDKTGLIDGMNITAVVSLNEQTVPALPSEAIVTWQGQDYIFIVTGEMYSGDEKDSAGEVTFERIPVAKGTTDVGYTEITLLKAIPADARVVTKGAFFVLAKMTNAGEHDDH